MGSSPGLRGGFVPRNSATISSTLLPSTPKAANSLALTFITRGKRPGDLLSPMKHGKGEALFQGHGRMPAENLRRLSRVTIENLNIQRPLRNRVPNDFAPKACFLFQGIHHFFHGDPTPGRKIENLA